MLKVESNSASETRAWGKKLARQLKGGEIIALIGNLGSGKTTFVQGLAQGLGIKDPIRSPTFVGHQIYHGKKFTLHHLDFYRFSPQEAEKSLYLPEIWREKNNILVIEWGGKVDAYLPSGTKIVEFIYLEPRRRQLIFRQK